MVTQELHLSHLDLLLIQHALFRLEQRIQAAECIYDDSELEMARAPMIAQIRWLQRNIRCLDLAEEERLSRIEREEEAIVDLPF